MTSQSIDGLLSDEAVLQEVGRRLLRRRLDLEWTQEELAKEAGVSKRTVERLEAGESTQMTSFLRILRALDLLAGLDQALPTTGPRPMELLELKGEQRKRAPRKRGFDESNWTWGDE